MILQLYQSPLLGFTVLLGVSTLWYSKRVRAAAHNSKLPPGPKGIPIFGNLFQLSKSPWKEFEIWKREYGSLVYINTAGQGILVLNTHEAASAFLEDRGRISGDRPRFIVAGEILTGGLMMPFMSRGEPFKRMRRACHDALSKAQVTKYDTFQLRQAATLVEGILQNPVTYYDQLCRATASVMLTILYDLPEVQSTDDPLVQDLIEFNRGLLRALSPGSHLVEFFTWMKHIPSPIAKWKRDAEQWHLKYSEIWQNLFRAVEARMADGDERPSFAGTLIRERNQHQLSDLEAAWLCATLYGGGPDTSVAILSWFILAMVRRPDIQAKCHEELDAIIGRARMPTFEDRDNLPYIQATVREALRWRSVAPLGAPHYTIEDEWYQGFLIPKGTVCYPNVWSMNREKAVYGDDADDFNPSRFIDEEGKLSPPLANTKDGHVSYGFGPRLCPGRHMANNILFIYIVSILWATKISPAKDESGDDIVPDPWKAVEGELAIRPLPFECEIRPRFEGAPDIIAQTRDLF